MFPSTFTEPLLSKGRLAKKRSLLAPVDNVYSIQKTVIEWFSYQGVRPVSMNSGRKALAKWLSKTETPYHEGMMIHADLEKTWRQRYQPDLSPSGFKLRDQSTDPTVATAAHRRFRKLIGRAPPPPPPRPGMTKTDRVLEMICKNMGWTKSFEEIFG